MAAPSTAPSTGESTGESTGDSSGKAQGGCLCGDVRFEVGLPTLWCAHCHCSLCRRAHGAAFVTWVGAAVERARVVDSNDVLHWYASSSDSERGFCRHCGTTLFFRSERWPGELHIALACFYAGAGGRIDREPDSHVFWDARVPWCAVGDSLEKRSRASG